MATYQVMEPHPFHSCNVMLLFLFLSMWSDEFPVVNVLLWTSWAESGFSHTHTRVFSAWVCVLNTLNVMICGIMRHNLRTSATGRTEADHFTNAQVWLSVIRTSGLEWCKFVFCVVFFHVPTCEQKPLLVQVKTLVLQKARRMEEIFSCLITIIIFCIPLKKCNQFKIRSNQHFNLHGLVCHALY